MGSHKDKDKRKRRSSPDPDGEGRSKRHRNSEEKSEKRKEKKSHKHRSDKEKKPKDKHKRKHKKHDRHSKHEVQALSKDDYFLKNNEFATWLKEEKDIFFSDLSSESARELFLDFVKDWNNQKLDSRFYEGIASGPRTSHSWKIRE